MSKISWALACALVVATAASSSGAPGQAGNPFEDGQTPPAAGPSSAQAQEVDPFGEGGAPAAPAAAAAMSAPSASPDTSEASQSPAAAEARIERMLGQKLKQPLDFTEVPLSQVADMLREEYDLPIQFDLPALDASAMSPDVEVTINVTNMSLRSALELTLRQLEGLTYVVDNEVLLITTQDEADQRLRIVVYRVDDLVRVGDGPLNSADSYDFDSLVDILLSSVEKDSWEEAGTGEGEMHSYPPGMLVVTSTSRVHDQIARLLADMRRVKGEIEADPAQATAASQGPITRGIAIKDKSVGDSDTSREMVRNAIVQSVDWGSDVAANTGEHFLYVLPQRVIVRHQPHVVRQVEKVMANMGTSADRRGGRGGGGGFF